MSGEITLHYWPIKARTYATMAIAQAGGVPVKHTSNPDLPGLKPELPFGQLPYLVHGDFKIAQSNAILRYVAKLAKLEGDNEQEYGVSNMYIEEANDLYNLFVKANYSTDKVTAYNELFASEGAFAKQLAFLEKLHAGIDVPKRLAGDYALVAMLDIALNIEPSCLDNFPKIKLFTEAVLASPAFDGIRDFGMYFKRE